MPKRVRSALTFLTGSDIGILFLLVNIVVMAWVALLMSRPFPPGFDVCVGVIFGGKTIHSVVTYDKKKGGLNNNDEGYDNEEHG